jgi:uncharacterized delta-60 repeat protein
MIMYNKVTITFFLFIFFSTFTKISFSQYGQLDPAFGQNGIVTTAINVTPTGIAYSAVIQSDGKIVAAGFASNGSNNDFALVRYNSNGSLDNTFGTNGIVTTPVGTSGDIAYSIAIQSDDKIVAAGYAGGGSNSEFALVRYNSNGSLDNTFGTNGIVTTPVGTGGDEASSVSIQSDGKIVVAGSSWNGSNYDFAVVRYNSDGSLDNTFGTNGIVTTPVGTSADIARSVAIQSDGKIVAAGHINNGSNDDFALVRYNSNGSLDNTFGTNGIVTTLVGTSNDRAYSIAIQSDGKIAAAGYSWNVSDIDFAVVRYNSNGSLDITFGSNGIVTTPVGSSVDIAYSIAIQSDGKIIAAGYSLNIGNNDFAVVRYNSNGFLDNTFGINGIITTSVYVGSSGDIARSVAIQSDGKIVAAGYAGGQSVYDFALVRYNSNGSLDNTFETDGIVTTPVGISESNVNSVAIQSDGKIVAAGYSLDLADYFGDFAVARYNADGTLDNTFGQNGTITTPIGLLNEIANSVAIQSDGKIIAAGYSHNLSNYDFALVRYNTNGALDNTFGTNGIVTTPVGASNDFAYSIAIQSDGKIVAAGYSSNGSDYDFALVRYNSNGALDNTFGTNGIVITPVGTSDDRALSIAIQNDGKITATGYSDNGIDYDFALVRYNSNGALDNTFGTNGIVITPVGALNDYALSVAIQSDGKIAAAGYSNVGNNYDFALVRYNSNGALDNTFGTNGIVTTPVGTSDDYARSIAIQSDGKIVTAGNSWNGSDFDFAVVRYNSNGALDNTFGTNGSVITNAGTSFDYAFSMTIQNDDKILIAGNSDNGNGYSVFSLVRYLDDGSTGAGEEGNREIPTEFALEQNYPNPFNPSTSIQYRVASISQVILTVYDVLGNEITTLVNEEKPAGHYEVEFYGTTLPSGIYFYKLQTGSFVETKKMILIK